MPHAHPRGWSRLLLGMVGFLIPLGCQSQSVTLVRKVVLVEP